MQSAPKVGLLVVVFVGLFYGAYLVLGRSILAPKTSTYYAEFQDAGGVSKGAKVLLAGVSIGTVQQVQLTDDHRARLTLDIIKGVNIPEGSTAHVSSPLIALGDNPVEIFLPENKSAPPLPPGSTLVGMKGGALDGILPDAGETMGELNKTLAATRNLLESEELMDKLTSLMTTSEQTIASFGNIADSANSLLVQNNENINQAMNDAAMAMQDIREATALATAMLKQGNYPKKTADLLDNLNATTAEAEKLVKSLNDFINDPELRGPLNQTVANVATITDTSTRIAENAEKMSADGTVISKKAIELATKANEIADEAKGLLQQFRNIVGGGPKASSLGDIDVEMNLFRETDPNRWRTDFSSTFNLPDSKLSLGVYDAFETNRLNIQLGKSFARRAQYRYGVYASKPGLGLDYDVTPKLRLRSDLFDINDPQLDFRAKYSFGKGLIGWFGVDRLFDDNAPIIGIGVEK